MMATTTSNSTSVKPLQRLFAVRIASPVSLIFAEINEDGSLSTLKAETTTPFAGLMPLYDKKLNRYRIRKPCFKGSSGSTRNW